MQNRKLSDLMRSPSEAGLDASTEASSIPKYLTLVRKETRLREDQLDRLTALTRKLNRQKASGEGERITENTLIRVAIDLLLLQSDRLSGTTEEELRAALYSASDD